MIEHKEWGEVPQVDRPDTATNECPRALTMICKYGPQTGYKAPNLPLRFPSLGLALLLDEIQSRAPFPELKVLRST